jgi:hypothetical protein
VPVGTSVVFSEDSTGHRYIICQDSKSHSYFLTVDEQPYQEDGRLFEGSFDELLDKLRDLKRAESLKTFF